MSDFIKIEGLEVFANHGVFKEEVNLGQKFIITAVLYFDISPAGRFDDLDKSVNYAEVCKYITGFMRNNTFKLIETVAERLAREILVRYKVFESCEIIVKKPWAPIGLPLECVSVGVKRCWHKVYLSIGSNMGDKKAYLDGAICALSADGCIRVNKCSSYIVTKPYGGVKQDDFLNGAVEIMTLYSPSELLDFIHEIEAKYKRVRDVRWGPRTLDIDILFYDDLVMDSQELTIPHKDLQNREFVLIPMQEIAPYMRHPVSKKSMTEMLADITICK